MKLNEIWKPVEEKQAIEIEFSKRLIIEEIKRFSELYKSKEGIGEQGLDELADKILSFSKDYISKDKIREKIKEIMGYTFTLVEERHCQDYACDRLKELLEEN